MKLAEISSDRFNDLVVSEPNVTFYQTSNWADYKSLDGLEPLFLGYVDEHDVYSALGMFLIKESKSLFKKSYSLMCPYGFLINYYDFDLLESFIRDLISYMKNNGYVSLTINPNIAKDGNGYVKDVLLKLGFAETDSTYCFNYYDISQEPVMMEEDIVFNTKELLDDVSDFSRIMNDGVDYASLYEAMKPYIHFFVTELSAEETISKLKNSILELKKYISVHEEDFAAIEEVESKRKLLEEKEHALEEASRIASESINPVLGGSCLVTFGKSAIELVSLTNNNFKIGDIDEQLYISNIRFLQPLGYRSMYSSKEGKESAKIELLGEFTFTI